MHHLFKKKKITLHPLTFPQGSLDSIIHTTQPLFDSPWVPYSSLSVLRRVSHRLPLFPLSSLSVIVITVLP
ncbi:hypothetical protein RIF29_15614 [Crotalaria pallida]|uniref:Uncharacterized protein n=1 Tax=Crotalaria pallida TaxID=3830 RepID=A0AAN9FFV1_CROPI